MLILFSLGCVLAPGTVAAQARRDTSAAQIAAVPVIVRLSAGDSAANAVVEVRNDGGGQAQLKFYLGDFEQAENGDFTFLPFGSGPHSCGSRLTAFPDGAVLLARERQQVQLRLAGGAGVCWSMLFVETQPQGRGTIKIAQRVGIKILNAPAHATRAGEVSTVTVKRQRGDTLAVHVIFQNTGQAPVDLRGRVEIRDYSGKVLSQKEFGPYGSLPGRARDLDLDVPAQLVRGDYVVVPIVDFGGDFLAGGQATLKVP